MTTPQEEPPDKCEMVRNVLARVGELIIHRDKEAKERVLEKEPRKVKEVSVQMLGREGKISLEIRGDSKNVVDWLNGKTTFQNCALVLCKIGLWRWPASISLLVGRCEVLVRDRVCASFSTALEEAVLVASGTGGRHTDAVCRDALPPPCGGSGIM